MVLNCLLEALIVSGIFSLAKNFTSTELSLYEIIYVGAIVLSATFIRTLNSAFASSFLTYVSTKSSNYIIDLLLWKDAESRDNITEKAEISSITIELNNLLIMCYLPITNFVSAITVSISISIAMFISDFSATLTALLFLISGYSGIYLYTRRKAKANSHRIYNYEKYILSTSMNFLRTIRMTTLSQSIAKFERKIKYSNKLLRKSQLANQLLAILPRSIIETVFLFSLLLVYFLTPNKTQGLAAIAGLAFGAQKLLPNIQFAYSNLVTIQGNKTSAFTAIQKVLIARSDVFRNYKNNNNKKISKSPQIYSISVGNLSYSYPRSSKILRFPDFNLKSRTLTVLTGPSGSGKSTLVDLVLGLRTAKSGYVLLNTNTGAADFNNTHIHKYWKNISLMEQIPSTNDVSLIKYLDPTAKHTISEIMNALKVVGMLNEVKAKVK